MMHPDPKQRPCVDEILSERSLVLANYQQSCYRACNWTVSRCKCAVAMLWAVILFICGLFPGELKGKVEDFPNGSLTVLKHSKVSDSAAVGADKESGEGGGVTDDGMSQTDHSFSDEDELVQFTSPNSDDGAEPDAKFNRSWIRYHVCVLRILLYLMLHFFLVDTVL